MPTDTVALLARLQSLPRWVRRGGRAAPATRGAITLAGAFLCLAAALSGCQAPPQPTGPTDIILHIPDYDAFVDASLSILRRYDFPPDRVDRSRGLIVSHPTTSGQWFEWWRVDSPGAYQTLESSLHTTRRVVAIDIQPVAVTAAATTEPTALASQPGGADILPADRPDTVQGHPQPPAAAGPAGGTFRVGVRVDKLRYTAPERQITTASGALALYSERTPTVEGLRGPQSRHADWVPLGRDPLLEAFLLAKLSNALPAVAVAED